MVKDGKIIDLAEYRVLKEFNELEFIDDIEGDDFLMMRTLLRSIGICLKIYQS